MAARADTAAIIEMNSVTAIVRCLRAGLGVALLPEHVVVEEITSRTLKKLRWHEPLAEDLFFVRHRDKPLTGAYGAFVSLVEDYFTELRACRHTARIPLRV